MIYLMVLFLKYSIALLSFTTFLLISSIRFWKCRFKDNLINKRIAFFHPYCNAGGGGERVLWLMIKSLQKSHPKNKIVVYTGDLDATPQDFITKAENIFKIKIDSPIEFIYLKQRWLVEASSYPYFTLIGQSVGSLFLALEAIYKHVPDVFIDSMGYSFTYPIFKYLGGCKIFSYVHYPTISTEMLKTVSSSILTFNNRAFISRSPSLTKLKIIYYRIFAYIYGFMGRISDLVFVNSSWTIDHVNGLWKCPNKIHLLYPPCNVMEFEKLPLERKNLPIIVSVAQFRPEKNHHKQLQIFKMFNDKINCKKLESKLILIGSCRNTDDEKRVEMLKLHASNLGISDRVEFRLNISFEEMFEILKGSNIALHTMMNEHFGIGIVELMAAGLIVIANNSGGPKMDIIENGKTGYLAQDPEEYSNYLEEIIYSDDQKLLKIRNDARIASGRFSDRNFERKFLEIITPLLDS